MQVVIIAGGLGTRLKSVAPDTPKALVPVAGRPFVEHQLELIRKNGMDDVLICVGYGADKIEGHLGDGAKWGVRVRYSREDPAKLLGTGGALVNALPLLADSFFTLWGDSYLPTDYRAMEQAFVKSGCPSQMSVYRNEGRWDSSNARIARGMVIFYSKSAKPGEADYIDYGLSAFKKYVIEGYENARPPLDLATIQGDLVRRGEMAAFEAMDRFYEIGKPEGLRELDGYLREREGL